MSDLTERQRSALAEFCEAFHLSIDSEFIPVSPQLLDSMEQQKMDARVYLVGVQRDGYPFVELLLQNREASR